MQSIKQYCGVLSLLLLAACDGNPFVDPPVVPPVVPPANDATVVVPDVLLGNIQKVIYTPGATPADSTLQIQITGLDTTPLLATWTYNQALSVAGYTAFSVQEDALDRLFVGLAATSADGSVRGVVAGDGGQFNNAFSGSSFARTGAFTPPDATGSRPATGQVSYAGSYVGLLNGGGDGSALIPPPPGTDPELLPREPARVTGDAFLNANFADNTVNGAVYNRVIVGSGFGLESIILVPSTITANGTFQGGVQRIDQPGVSAVVVGDYGGVFGGTNAAAVAGAVSLKQVYDTVGTGTEIEGALERGIFVLNQCGLAGVPVAAGCAGTAP